MKPLTVWQTDRDKLFELPLTCSDFSKSDMIAWSSLDKFFFSSTGDSNLKLFEKSVVEQWDDRKETISFSNQLNVGKTTSKFGLALLCLNMIIGNNFSKNSEMLAPNEETLKCVQGFDNKISEERKIFEAVRTAKIRSVRGKYSRINASSEGFIANKKNELDLESQ
jgi:hypothetical protein